MDDAERDRDRPPRLAAWLLGRLLPRDVAESFAGDMEERYRVLKRERGRLRAQTWYAWQLVRCRPITLRSTWRRIRRERPRTGAQGARMSASVWDRTVRDVRFGLRAMSRSPGYALAAVLTLGLGTGAATAVFSLVEGVILRPLPYEEPDRLLQLWEANQERGLDREPVSPVNFLDYRAASVISDAAAWWVPQVNLSDAAGDPIRVNTVEASENLFAVMGVEPVIGRTFPLDSTLHGSEPEVVISHRLWRARFAEDRDIAGEVVHLNGSPFTVVGVMPPDFRFPDDTDVWQRLQWDLSQHTRYAHFMGVVARLSDDATIDRARAELDAITTRLAEENAASNDGWRARAVPLDVEVAGVFRPGLLALFGAAGLLLVIACINVANLSLARGVTRAREVAVRSAMGASRGRLIAQLLTESGMLAVAGATLGFAIAALALRAVLAWSPVEIPRADEVTINLAVLVFAIVVATITVLGFGLAPALATSRTRLGDILRQGVRGGSGGRASGRARAALVIAEVALAVVLLSGAGLLIRSVVEMMRVDPGVQSQGVVSANLQLPAGQYSDWNDVARFYATLATNLSENPAIARVGSSNILPLDPGWRITYEIAGTPTSAEDAPMAQYHTIDDGWRQALGVPLLEGRGFRPIDDVDGRPAILVNDALVQRHWPNGSAVGRRITVATGAIGPLGTRIIEPRSVPVDFEIVGVVGNVRNASLAAQAEPAIFFTQRQYPFRSMNLFVAGPGATRDLMAAVRSEVARLDATLPIANVTSLERILAAPADPPRLVMLVLAVFSAIAIALAAVGIYGVLSFAVTNRRREIGIRMALGARPAGVLFMILRQGVTLGAAGAVIGVLAAALTGRLLAGLLFDVRPTDPVTLTVALVAAFLVSLAACLVPGRRAALTQPIRSLRSE